MSRRSCKTTWRASSWASTRQAILRLARFRSAARQIVAVADTGLDDTHPDFAGRISALIALGRPPADASDPHGHGTHVAGSVLGDGSASGGALRGVAPQASLYFRSLLHANGRLGGIALPTRHTFRRGLQRGGARIHNNSWGAATASAYRVNSDEVDDYVHTHEGMLVVISAGNAAPPIPRSGNGMRHWGSSTG